MKTLNLQSRDLKLGSITISFKVHGLREQKGLYYLIPTPFWMHQDFQYHETLKFLGNNYSFGFKFLLWSILVGITIHKP